MSAQYEPGPEDNAAESTDNPGRRLRVARQAQGLTLDRVAAQLHLSPSIVESLEHDDYDALPGQVFIVGYIRKYARVVGLDAEPLLAAYHNAVPQVSRTWLHPGATPGNAAQVGSGHLAVSLVSIAILILLCGLAFVWWQNQPPKEELETVDTGMETEWDASEPAIPEPIPEQGVPSPMGNGEPTAPAAPQTPAELQPELQPEPPAAVEQQPPAEVPATATATSDADGEPDASADSATAAENAQEKEAAGPGEIVMTFDGPCWVDVRDSERTYKLFGEMKKGDRHLLAGTPPYSVILGNAAAVQITVDGTAFDLSSVSQGNVARFNLDPSETP